MIFTRNTAETDIKLTIGEKSETEIVTGVGFLDHMLTLFSRHANIPLSVKCKGDVEVDAHHTTEDIGIVFGKALLEYMGDKKGITRYGNIILPMDETLVLCAVDISGRGGLYYEVDGLKDKVGDFDTELCEEFFTGFAREAGITLHIRKIAGTNSHHIIEGIFKAVARALRQALKCDPDEEGRVPSTKGVL
jgi:imidazoleglycerol-phosphate dehydratase